ncbi:MAG: TetR/AcrR family transcriptional regulator [Thermoanaerobaculia bacterium]
MTKGTDTREAILDIALAKASQVGLGALSIGELAKEAGMSKSGLFAHFDSKENLQLEVMKSAAQRFIDRIVTPALRAPRGEPRVRALFEGWFRWAKDSKLPGGCLFIAAATELDDQPGPLRDFLVSSQRDWLAAFAQAAKIAIDEKHFRSDLDTEKFARRAYSIILAFHHFSRLLRLNDAEAQAQSEFEALLAESRA